MTTQQITLRMSLSATYTVPMGVPADELREHLERGTTAAIGLGLLTDRGDVEVDQHSLGVEIVPNEQSEAIALFQQSLAANRDLLQGLVGKYEEVSKRTGPAPGFENFLSAQVEALSTDLASSAANAVGDDEEQQDEAIGASEAWVSDNVSSDTTARLASVLWTKGVYAGTVEILRWLN
ncbi:hypothetical protein AB4Y45_35685 [Paraburkholderia sp. EG287A]|uniref:hypothetical protein n=1 Tax=Paraburkholderia sp. EG287A TaxID=3237012 RepID=UPI0034D16C47